MELMIRNLQHVAPEDFEVIERKGLGHPDTLSDDLAEELSRVYANYTLENFGVILHHNFDKVGILGGRSYVAFGDGYLTSPIRILLNGRVTMKVGDEGIPVIDLLQSTARQFLKKRFPMIDPEKHLVFQNNISTGSSPGHVETGTRKRANRKSWFTPESLGDIREQWVLQSNDTSVGCGYYPLTPLERAVLEIEHRLTTGEYGKSRPWIGNDIKVMAYRIRNHAKFTICVPQIANFVPNAKSYKSNMDELHRVIKGWADQLLPDCTKTELWMNTKDDFSIPELYMTAIGSSIESGDEGLVGRGNRTNGLISMCRPYSMEGACGKNPVYHVGKLYNIAAMKIARQLFEVFGATATVIVIGQEGRKLMDPWQVIVSLDKDIPQQSIEDIVEKGIRNIPNFTKALLKGKMRLA